LSAGHFDHRVWVGVEAETGVPVELEAGGFTVGQPVAAAPVPGRAIPA
jgi:hypothetical protein